ncbi:MAG: tetratricopeptide repeat protein, partial [Candidatus Heimdallarchaeota archaeon]
MKKLDEISDPTELMKYSEMLIEEERYEKALLGVQKAIKLKPDFFEAWHMQGDVYYNLYKDKEAITSYKKALQLKEDKLVWFDMGMAYSELEEYESAQECFEKTLALDKNYTLAWNNLGFTFSRLGDQQKAVEYFTRATELEPKDPYFWENLGVHYYQMLKNYQEAAKCYEKVVKLDPKYPKVWEKIFYSYTELKKGKKVIQAIMNLIKGYQENNDDLPISTILFLLAVKDSELAQEVFSDNKLQKEVAKYAKASDAAQEYNRIAWSFFMGKLYSIGTNFSRQAVIRDPQFAAFQDTLACNLYGLGKEENDKALLQ